jgi:hypothetical protein
MTEKLYPSEEVQKVSAILANEAMTLDSAWRLWAANELPDKQLILRVCSAVRTLRACAEGLSQKGG